MNASRIGSSTQKTLQECTHSSKASGATLAGALEPPRNVTTTGREESPNRKPQHLRVPTDTTAKAWGLLSGTTIGVPKQLRTRSIPVVDG
jgi:hypothetical protein